MKDALQTRLSAKSYVNIEIWTGTWNLGGASPGTHYFLIFFSI